jgi:hypothetical protein
MNCEECRKNLERRSVRQWNKIVKLMEDVGISELDRLILEGAIREYRVLGIDLQMMHTREMEELYDEQFKVRILGRYAGGTEKNAV